MTRPLRYLRCAPLCVLALLLGAPPGLTAQIVTSSGMRGVDGGGVTAGKAQQQVDSARVEAESSLMLSLGAGYARYVAPYESPIAIERSGVGFSLAVEWRPGARLRVAIESGWTTFYSYELTDVETSFGSTDASLSLSAVPLLAVFSMPVAGPFVLHAGTGGYFVRSHATSFSETVDVVRFAQGWVAAASWDHAVGGGFRLGATLKWYGATEFEDAALLLQLRAVIPVVVW